MKKKIDPLMLWQLEHHGFCVLEDFINDVREFEEITSSWLKQLYHSAIRSHLKLDVGDQYTTQVGKTTRLLAHAEAYYRPSLPPPDVGFLWCAKAPQVSGGETFIVDGKTFYECLPENLKKRFYDQGIVYESTWSQDRWSIEFNVRDVTELTQWLSVNQSCDFSFTEDSKLHLFYKSNPIICHNHDHFFINGLLAHLPRINHPRYESSVYTNLASNRVLWGDTLKPLSDYEINQLIDIQDDILQKHQWKDNQLMIINNHRVMHGREPVALNDDRLIYSRFGYW